MEEDTKYLTGMPAMNIVCGDLDVTGDWHRFSINWDKVQLRDYRDSNFGDWGIVRNVWIEELDSFHNVANVLRACLDLIDMERFAPAGGMYKDYIGNDLYNDVIFDKVLEMKVWKTEEEWERIDAFMCKEYRMKWIRYRNIAPLLTDDQRKK